MRSNACVSGQGSLSLCITREQDASYGNLMTSRLPTRNGIECESNGRNSAGQVWNVSRAQGKATLEES
ncbi:hypothetical protein MHYP_G00289420 [Metynnis hypsauchen]